MNIFSTFGSCDASMDIVDDKVEVVVQSVDGSGDRYEFDMGEGEAMAMAQGIIKHYIGKKQLESALGGSK
ncbi:hypothetical protein MYOV003v1_p0038 [Vibrio phage 207E48.1]|nr:hypothetical protein MYOV003v1_p0038 [Vibrio phage 207E48.1]